MYPGKSWIPDLGVVKLVIGDGLEVKEAEGRGMNPFNILAGWERGTGKKPAKEEQNLNDYSTESNIKNCLILGFFIVLCFSCTMSKLSDILLPTLIIILKRCYNKYWPKVTLTMIGWGMEEQWVSGPCKLSLSILKK